MLRYEVSVHLHYIFCCPFTTTKKSKILLITNIIFTLQNFRRPQQAIDLTEEERKEWRDAIFAMNVSPMAYEFYPSPKKMLLVLKVTFKCSCMS